MNRLFSWLVVALFILVLPLTGCSLPQVSAEQRLFLDLSLDFLGEYRLPRINFQATPVGGLSGITYDRSQDQFYAISDDRSDLAPARFYTLKLSLDPNNPKTPTIQQVEVKGVTSLLNQDSQPYAKGTLDPEGIALSPLGSVFISSEGVARDQISPFVTEFDLKTGQWKRSLPIPERYVPAVKNNQFQGVGDNLGFEALTLSLAGTAIEPFRLFTATESALAQDIDDDHPQQGASRNRLLHYSIDPSRTLLVSEHLYLMDPPPEGTMFHGLPELLAIDQAGHFLSLERSFGSKGFTVKLFQLAMGDATDTSMIERFKGLSKGLQPIRKQLLLNLNDLNIPLDNLEGMTLGPHLPDGSQSLLLVSDDNFSSKQVTQFLLFRLRGLR
jgi:hypothetical protein